MWYVVTLLTIAAVAALIVSFSNAKKVDQLEDRIIKLAIKLNDANDMIDRVDESNTYGLKNLNESLREKEKMVHELSLEFETFKNLYGDAVIEEKRQAAKAQKALAEGIDNIMTYDFESARRGRGDAK